MSSAEEEGGVLEEGRELFELVDVKNRIARERDCVSVSGICKIRSKLSNNLNRNG
jgi:hypothetical protein